VSYKTNHFDDEVVRLLKCGGVGLLPADTIYGLSCLALDEAAVKRLRRLKGRSQQKPFIVLFSDYGQLKDLNMPTARLKLVKKYWPGPLSLEWDASKSPVWLHPASDTFAIRMPNRADLLQLIEQVGPITSTSANPEGHPPAMSVASANKYFGEQLGFYVRGGQTKKPVASTLVRLQASELKVLRQGAVTIKP